MRTYFTCCKTDQKKLLVAFLSANNILFATNDDDELLPYVLAGIAKAQPDVKAGRVITSEEFKKRF